MNPKTKYQPGRAWLMATLLFLFMFVNFADKIVLGLLAVPIMNEMKFTPAEFGLIGSSFFWLFAIAGVIGGVLAGRVKTKWLLFAMAVIWAAMQLPIVYGSTLTVFIVARALLGMGEGPAWPVAVYSSYKWFPDEKRNLPVALFAQGAAVGLLLAGLTIPLVNARFGWRAAFIGLAAFGAIWALVWLLVGREGPIDDRESASKAAVRDVSLKRVIADPTVWSNFLMQFAAYWSLAEVLTWLPAYFQKGLGFNNVAAGRMYALIIALVIPLVMLTSWWSQHLLARGWSSHAARGRFASLGLIITGVIFTAMVVPGLPVGARIAMLALALGCVQPIYALGPAMLAEVTPARRLSTVIALDNSVASFAGILAPFIAGALIQRYPGAHGFELGFLLTGVLLVGGGVIGWFAANPERSIERLYAATPTRVEASPDDRAAFSES